MEPLTDMWGHGGIAMGTVVYRWFGNCGWAHDWVEGNEWRFTATFVHMVG